MNGLSIDWFYNQKNVQENIFDLTVASLFDNGKITKFSYSILKENVSPNNTEDFWFETLNVDGDLDWCTIHDNNFSSSIETKLRSFYFKIFHRAMLYQ